MVCLIVLMGYTILKRMYKRPSKTAQKIIIIQVVLSIGSIIDIIVAISLPDD